MLGGDFLGDMFRSVMGATVLWMGIVTVRFVRAGVCRLRSVIGAIVAGHS